MNFNPGTISMAALLLSTFFAGAFLNGERLRTQEARQELRDIEREQARILLRIDSLQRATLIKEKILLEQIDTAYQILGDISSKRANSIRRLNAINQAIAEKKKGIQSGIRSISETGFQEFTFYNQQEQ